jgi:exopolysaccharide production protein ExoZ
MQGLFRVPAALTALSPSDCVVRRREEESPGVNFGVLLGRGPAMTIDTKHSSLLDVIRGIAALQVVISHAVASDMVFWGVGFGAVTGVYLFFLLSGFLIWSSAKSVLPTDNGLWTYAVHRIARIAPLYYVALLVGITIAPYLVYYHQDISWNTVLRHIFFAQTVQPVVYRAINPLLWTLTLEVIFYLAVPALFLIGRGRHFWAIILLAPCLLFVGRYDLTRFSFFCSFFYLFVIGMTLEQYRWLISWPLGLLTTIIAAVVWTLHLDYRLICTFVALAMFVWILLAKPLERTWLFRCLAFLGVISYSLYIWNEMLIDAIATPLAHYVQSPYGRAPILIMAAILFAWPSYRLIEAPAQALVRRRLLPRRSEPNLLPASS